jgi:hypothetical protein
VTRTDGPSEVAEESRRESQRVADARISRVNHAMTRSSCRPAESDVFRTRRGGLGLTVQLNTGNAIPGERRARSTADSGASQWLNLGASGFWSVH